MTPWTVVHQAPLSMGFFRQEFWSGLPLSSPGDLPDPGIGPHLLRWQVDSLLLSHQGCPLCPLGEVIQVEKRICVKGTTLKNDRCFPRCFPSPKKNPRFSPQNFISKSLTIIPLWNSLLNTCVGIYIGIFNLCNKPIHTVNAIIWPILQRRNWGSKSFENSPKVTERISDGARICFQTLWSLSLCSSLHPSIPASLLWWDLTALLLKCPQR